MIRLFTFLSFILIFFESLFLSKGLIVKVEAQNTCATQAAVTGVTVEYPGCVGTDCNFTQASCAWTAATGATNYIVNVTELETSVAIKTNETEAPTITKIVFPITQNRTYKCDVVAVNSCGSRSAVASDQLLCAANGLLGSVTPTTSAVRPSTPIASPGGTEQSIIIFAGIGLIIFTGLILLKSG